MHKHSPFPPPLFTSCIMPVELCNNQRNSPQAHTRAVLRSQPQTHTHTHRRTAIQAHTHTDGQRYKHTFPYSRTLCVCGKPPRLKAQRLGSMMLLKSFILAMHCEPQANRKQQCTGTKQQHVGECWGTVKGGPCLASFEPCK